MSNLLTISLNNVRFRAYHGIHPDERQKGNDFVVNMTVCYITGQKTILALDDTIDYVVLFDIINTTMQQPVDLLETLAQTIANNVHRQFPQVKQVTVGVEKLNPPIDKFSGTAGVKHIKYYNYETKETKSFTNTHEREYSPTVTPDEKYVSCIIQRDNGAQDLAKFPVNGGKPEVLVWHLKVGYHTWLGMNKVFLYVLDDSIHNSLHNYEVSTNMDTVIAENIGRSLHPVPWEQALSY